MWNSATIYWDRAWRDSVAGDRNNNGDRASLDKWQDLEECRRFDRRVKEDNWKRSRGIIGKLDISPRSRVLDIGAGPGTLAIPLAQTVEHVTVVEPSDAMLQCLRDNIEATGVENIAVVRKKWEDIDLEKDLFPPYDIVISSYSLGMPDLAAALKKMDAVAGKYVYVYWFADPSPWERNYAEVWEKMHGVPYRKKGKADIIFNALYAVGIYPNVDIYPEESVNYYDSLDRAMADQKSAYSVTDERQEAILRDFLSEKLQAENGRFVMRGRSHRARIWWKKEGAIL